MWDVHGTISQTAFAEAALEITLERLKNASKDF
jgi:hypothetical protein